MHSVHDDLHKFIKNYRVEHNDLTVKVQKMQEVAHRCLDSIDEVKESIEKSATVLTCMLEFNSIEQALMFHDENSDQRRIMVT